MKTILCFGDSITWGYNPKNASRYEFTERWPGFLQAALGNDYKIIEAALNGRTTVFDDPFNAGRNGSMVFPISLESNLPVDLVTILLGTNDIKAYISGSAAEAAAGCATLIRQVLTSCAGINGAAPKVLLLSPPLITKPVDFMDTIFDHNTVTQAKQFALHYQRVAKLYNIAFLDTATIVTASTADGIHLDVHENEKLGTAVAQQIKKILA